MEISDIYKKLEGAIKGKLRSLPKLCLASVSIGEDSSAKAYCVSQEKTARELGIEYKFVNLPPDISFEDFKLKVKVLNNDKSITGIIINKPFPKDWKETEAFSTIDCNKDVEGMHLVNLGKFLKGKNQIINSLFEEDDLILVSPTVLSIIKLLDEATGHKYRGKIVTIVGSSLLIGQPLALFLVNELATVTLVNIETPKDDIPKYIGSSDIVVSAAGVPDLIKGDWIKEGAVVIDVGTGSKDGRIAGDVEFEKASKKTSFITPVPGGVGKLTPLFLYHNLIVAHILADKKKT